MLSAWLEGHMLPCGLKMLLGADCPGCGMQRAFIALLRGELLLSLQLNAALLPFLTTFFYTILHLLFKFRNGAATVLFLFGTTALVMLVNFVIKLFYIH